MGGVVDDHKDYVAAAEAQNCSDPECTDPLHAHDHSHSRHQSRDDHTNDGQPNNAMDCKNPDCSDTSHGHSHSHSSDVVTHVDPDDCTDASHSHSHTHSSDMVSDAVKYADPDKCTDASHSHSHTHSSDIVTQADPNDCTDTSHSHSHSQSSDVVTHAGIGTYVYRARRPFHPSRLISFLQKLPVVRGVPPGQGGNNIDIDDSANKIFKRVLRSKGFCWTADSNVKALYWSQAGCSFEMQCLGRWWTTLPKQLVSNKK